MVDVRGDKMPFISHILKFSMPYAAQHLALSMCLCMLCAMRARIIYFFPLFRLSMSHDTHYTHTHAGFAIPNWVIMQSRFLTWPTKFVPIGSLWITTKTTPFIRANLAYVVQLLNILQLQFTAIFYVCECASARMNYEYVWEYQAYEQKHIRLISNIWYTDPHIHNI